MSKGHMLEIISKACDGKFPVNMYKIYEAVGIAIVKTDKDFTTISRNAAWALQVGLAKYPSHVSERWALAFALGRIVNGIEHDTISRDNFMLGENTKYIDKKCSNFALQLLIPETYLKFAIENEQIYTLSGLTKVFGVSDAAMVYRCKCLGIVN